MNRGSQACAACKYQRRKCAPNCELAPYFPPHHQKDFLNAQKLFGVSNITKHIRDLPPDQKPIAMTSLIFQANARAVDPVGGCYRIISDLQRQTQLYKAELDLVLHQLAICRAQEQVTTQQHQPQTQQQTQSIDAIDVYDAIPVQSLEYCHPVYYQDKKQLFNHGSVVKVELDSSSSVVHGKHGLVDVGEDIKPFLGVFDERDTVPFECSDNKIVVKENVESIQYEQEHDLKDAASLFTLTNSKE